MNFTPWPIPQGRKTQVWQVSAIVGGDVLGLVEWRRGWRRYVFEPEGDVVFDACCLREMADFLERETAAQKGKLPVVVPAPDGGGPFDAAVDRVIARVDKKLGV
jgi:hypothetical protein